MVQAAASPAMMPAAKPFATSPSWPLLDRLLSDMLFSTSRKLE
jgi:hypothetical protein